jgi:hypothetical protein
MRRCDHHDHFSENPPAGLMPHDRLMKTIELFWTKVLPRVSNLSS